MTTATTEVPVGSLRSGWRLLRSAPDRLLVPTGVLLVTGTALHVLLQYVISETVATSRHCTRLYLGSVVPVDCGPSNARAQVALALGVVVLVAVAHLVVAGIYRAGLDLFDDRPVRGPFAGIRWGKVAAAALLLGVLLTLSTAFLLLPVLVVGFLTRYALLFVLEQGQGPWESVVSSTRLVVGDLRAELGFVLRAGLLLLGATLLLGVGLVVALPVVLAAQAQRFRVATDDSWWF